MNIEGRYRFNGGFKVKSAVYEVIVNPFSLLDLSISKKVIDNITLTLAGTNILNFKHNEFIGTPEIGRFVSAKLTYNF